MNNSQRSDIYINLLRNKFVFLRYIPLIIVSGGIIYLSSRPGLKSDFTPAIDYALRKGAHVLEYFLLFHTLWFAFVGSSFFRMSQSRFITVSAMVISVSMVFALSDEYHQIFVSGRTAKPLDIVFDALGVFAGYVLVSIFWRGKSVE
jgi:VanZ family protein